jgi:protease-4
MPGKEKITNLTVQAVRPVSYIGSLFQLVGRIIIGGAALIAVLILWVMAFGFIQSGRLPAGLIGGDIAQQQKSFNYITVAGKANSSEKLLVVDLTGMILGVPPFPNSDPYLYKAFGVTFGDQLKNQILAAAKVDAIKGILIQTTTPGGTIFGSVAIHDAIVMYQKQTKKPVVVWIEGGSMSGGVYSTVGASAIYAAPGSLTGSIGVNAGMLTYYDGPMALFQSNLGIETKGGVEVKSLHAGKGKDFGNPFRRATEEEVTNRQQAIDQLYKDFVDHVAANRGIESEKIVNDMGAYVFGNAQAEALGLIDATLSRDEAYAALAVLAGIKTNDFAIVRRAPGRISLLDGMIAEDGGEAKAESYSKFAPLIEEQKCRAFATMALAYHGPIDKNCT